MILDLFQTDEAVTHQLQVFTKRICQSILDTKLHIHTTCIFSHICHFRPMTRPNPLKHKFSTHSRPNPRVNPTHGQLWDIVKLLSRPGSHIILVFDPRHRYQIPRESLQRERKIHGGGKTAIFDWNRRLSQKRYEIGPWLLWNVNKML